MRSREQHVFALPAIDEEHEQGELAQHILERGYLAHLTPEALKKIACELLSTDKKQAGLGLERGFALPAIDEEHEQGELAQHILERGYLADVAPEAT